MPRRLWWLRVRPQFLICLVVLGLVCIGWRSVSFSLGDSAQERVSTSFFSLLYDSTFPGQPVAPVDCSVQACLALTFDDGPSPVATRQIVDLLYREHVPATFFFVGLHVAAHPELARHAYLHGHEIGNHSWAHPDMTKLTPVQAHTQVARTQAAIMAAGVPAPTLFRPPYGAVSPTVRAQVPLTFAMWNVDPEDWKQTDPAKIAAAISASAAPGRVIVLHDMYGPTADALQLVLPDLKSRFQLVTFSQLFNLLPGQRGEFYGR